MISLAALNPLVSAASTVPVSVPSYNASPAKNNVCVMGFAKTFLASRDVSDVYPYAPLA